MRASSDSQPFNVLELNKKRMPLATLFEELEQGMEEHHVACLRPNNNERITACSTMFWAVRGNHRGAPRL